MRFDVAEAPMLRPVSVGDVYAAHGPRHRGFWVVVAVVGNSCHLLGIDEHGAIVSTASYGAHALREREVIGYCQDLEAMGPIRIHWTHRG